MGQVIAFRGVTADGYPLTEKMLYAAAFYAASSPAFGAKIGHQVSPDRLPEGPARFIFEVCRQSWIADRVWPTSSITVMQRLRTRMEDGKLTRDELYAANAMLDEVEDDPHRPTEADVIAALAAVIRKDLAEQIADSAAEEFGHGSEFARTTKLIEAQRRVGVVDESLGVGIDDELVAEIEAVGALEKLPTGIGDLDRVIRGGPRRGTHSTWVGGTGSGKSIGLSQVSGTALIRGFNVAYATLEVIPPDVGARLFARLLGITIDEVFRDPKKAARMVKELEGLGRFKIKEFEPGIATFPNIADWYDSLEQQWGEKVDLGVVDYGDLVASHISGGKKTQDSDYTIGKHVATAMRGWAKDKKNWFWTASAARRQQGKKHVLDADDLADSMHKARTGELIVTINVDDADSTVKLKVAKHRHGGAGTVVGPLPLDFEHGCLTPSDDPAQA